MISFLALAAVSVWFVHTLESWGGSRGEGWRVRSNPLNENHRHVRRAELFFVCVKSLWK